MGLSAEDLKNRRDEIHEKSKGDMFWYNKLTDEELAIERGTADTREPDHLEDRCRPYMREIIKSKFKEDAQIPSWIMGVMITRLWTVTIHSKSINEFYETGATDFKGWFNVQASQKIDQMIDDLLIVGSLRQTI